MIRYQNSCEQMKMTSSLYNKLLIYKTCMFKKLIKGMIRISVCKKKCTTLPLDFNKQFYIGDCFYCCCCCCRAAYI